MLIEDDQIEVMKLMRAIKKIGGEHHFVEAKNGENALELLSHQENIPDLIFLDLNMPRLNGLEFLKILKSDEILRYIPIVILTTSSNRKDVLECYKIGVAGYILKPLKYDEYVNKINKTLDYWSSNELIKA
ncbi:MAG: response regulator [Bacteroidia bacterium]|jgi:CheY-like chemotaxis protein|nr:response regulator [Bacteroidia bacterium]NNF31684.1 response regulator [Flavobacteriaceae bacterium]NNJ81543.1 response regulator [Flavobacteriaceae bacterium]NNK55198.1 response regulator [Flavobacteriaceae bacterium]NNM10193.1 response regulator [Flavobacteriaceae bacterium]